MYGAGVSADVVLKIRGTRMCLHRWVVVIVCLVLWACGNNPAGEIGFVNETQHSDAQLWALWKTAQRNLSQEIDLNPLERQLHNAAPQIIPGDARALHTPPRHLVVSSQLDVSSATLYAVTGTAHPDPTGLIFCPQPCNVNYAPAYSLYAHPATHYAASWELAGNNFDVLVEYEFENQILNALGYDTAWR